MFGQKKWCHQIFGKNVLSSFFQHFGEKNFFENFCQKIFFFDFFLVLLFFFVFKKNSHYQEDWTHTGEIRRVMPQNLRFRKLSALTLLTSKELLKNIENSKSYSTLHFWKKKSKKKGPKISENLCGNATPKIVDHPCLNSFQESVSWL